MSGNDFAALIVGLFLAFLFFFFVIALMFVVCNPHLFHSDDDPMYRR
jgi:hypothetical protein